MTSVPFKNLPVTVTITAMVLLGLVAVAQNISAQQLSSADLSMMVQSTVSDSDAMLLAFVANDDTPGQTLSFSSTATDLTWANWTAALSGNFSGQTLSLAYVNGTVTAGTVTWDTTGTFGGASVTGGGISTVSYPTSSNFDLTLSDTLVYSGNTYALNSGDILGSILTNGDVMFGSPGNEEVGDPTLTVNGVPVVDGFYSYHRSYRDNGTSYLIQSDSWWGWVGAIGIVNDEDGSTTTPKTTGTLTTGIPEPSTLALVGIGLALVGYIARRRTAKP